MRLPTLRFLVVAMFLLALRGSSLYGQQPVETYTQLKTTSIPAPLIEGSGNSGTPPEASPPDSGKPMNAVAAATAANSPTAGDAKPAPAAAKQHKLGPLNVSVNWRFRTEAWDWFQPPTGQNSYAFEHSLLRIGLGQKSEAFEWLLEGAADAIVDLPPRAVQPGGWASWAWAAHTLSPTAISGIT